MTHKVELVKDLMYKGCENHWHCIYCNDYIPVHCYSKEELEKMECKGVIQNDRYGNKDSSL